MLTKYNESWWCVSRWQLFVVFAIATRNFNINCYLIHFHQPKRSSTFRNDHRHLLFRGSYMLVRKQATTLGVSKSKRTSSGANGFGPSTNNKVAKSTKEIPNDVRGDDLPIQKTIVPQQQVPFDVTTIEASKLDKWGLPPPTLEDIFPLPSNDTELIPINPSKQYTTLDIHKYLHDYNPNHINWKYVSIKTTSNMTDSMKKEMKLRLAHLSPPVFIIDDFLTEQECLDVQQIVTNVEVDGDEGNDAVVRVASKTISQTLALSKRTSTSWFCTYKSIPTVLAKLQHILGITDLSRCEEPQIVQYNTGQEFTYHYDILPQSQCASNGGQRVATILIYLNSIPNEKNGGSTTFRDLDDGTAQTLSIQPSQGSALIFFPSNQYGQPDDRTLHRSVPITNSKDDASSSNTSSISKWILQIWIHETSYNACLPSKNNSIDDASNDINIASRRLGYIP